MMVEGSQSSSASTPRSLAPGDRLGAFDVVAQIGAGGASVVWKGHDRLLDRFVAIKQIAPDLNGGADEIRERFRREARLQKQVSQSHQHLVKVHDCIEEPRGLFIVMEYVEGQNLEQLLASHPDPMDPRQALGITAAAASALEAIHKGGIIHRDLKPSNILLPASGGLKVSDFGIAAVLDDQDALTLGSVRYMAPEVASGEADARADIYSLGMIAYEMLAGRAAFHEAFKIVLRDQRNQQLRWMKWHANPRAKAPPLSRLNPRIPETLSDLVARMMEKDPALRIPDAAALLEAIRRHFAGGPAGEAAMSAGVTTAPAGSSSPAATPMVNPTEATAALPTPSRTPYVLIGLLALQVLVILGVWIWSNQQEQARARRQQAQARELFTTATEDYKAGNLTAAREKFDFLTQRLGSNSALGQPAEAYSTIIGGELAMKEKKYDQALELFQRADGMRISDTTRVRLKTLMTEAQQRAAFTREIAAIEALMAQGRYDLARQRLTEQSSYTPTKDEQQVLTDVGARLEDQADQAKVQAILNRAQGMVDDGRRDAAIEHLQEQRLRTPSRRIDELLSQLERQKRYDKMLADAAQAEQGGNLAGAVAALEQAQKIQQDAQVDARISRLKSRMEFAAGREAESRGDLDNARKHYRDAVGLAENPQAAAALERLKTADEKTAFVRAGDDAFAAGDFATAIKQYENALRMGPDARLRAKVTSSRVRQLVQQGQQYMTDGRLEEARTALSQARQWAPDDPEISRAIDQLGRQADYRRLVDEGDRLRSASRFGDAKRQYMKAREVMDTGEIRRRMDDTEFDHLIAQAKANMQAESWANAQAFLRTAIKMRRTPELDALYREVTAKLDSNATANQP